MGEPLAASKRNVRPKARRMSLFPVFSPGAEVEQAVPQGTGTAIGNMTARSGLAAAFDSTTSQDIAGSAASVTPNLWGTCGKDWGAGNTKKISYFKCYASTNGGFTDNDGSENIDITLRGNSTDTSGTQNSGTLLHTIATFTNATSATKEVLVVTTQTHFRYVWVQIVSDGSGTQVVLSELEFKEKV